MIEKQPVHTDKAPEAIGPYSQAIVAAPFVFTSGQIPVDPKTGAIVGSDASSQARQVLKNLAAVLAKADSDFSRVVKATVFLRDMEDFSAVNAVYADYFSKGVLPARSAIQIARLPKDVLVEIELIALQNQDEER